MTTCPFCGEQVTWDNTIRTGCSGDPNWIEGNCGCPDQMTSWKQEDRGGEWVARYRAEGDEYWTTVEDDED